MGLLNIQEHSRGKEDISLHCKDEFPGRDSRNSTGSDFSVKERDRADEEEAISSKFPHPQLCPSYGTEATPFNGNRKWIVDYYIKFPLLGNALICTALLINCSEGRSTSNTAPLTVFIAYSIANAYIILEYRIWQRISRLARQIFGIVGALAFIMEGAKEIYLSSLYSTANELDDKSFTTPTADVRQEKLTLVAALSLVEGGLYFVDIFNLSV